jgi:hypothetical protein
LWITNNESASVVVNTIALSLFRRRSSALLPSLSTSASVHHRPNSGTSPRPTQSFYRACASDIDRQCLVQRLH